MLYNLHAAMQSGTEPWLAASLRRRFPAALIDEFQDTDPLQFAIFNRMLTATAARAAVSGRRSQAGHLQLPQCRPACVPSRRAESASAEYTLADKSAFDQGVDRSAERALLSHRPRLRCCRASTLTRLEMGARERKPFSDRSLGAPTAGMDVRRQRPEARPLTKNGRRRPRRQATAAEIARLLSDAARAASRSSERALCPGDVAVLVRTHAQGSELKRARGLNVGSVELSQASVFSGRCRRSRASADRDRTSPRDALLRGALATEMMGNNAAEIARISSDESRLCLPGAIRRLPRHLAAPRGGL